VGRELEGSRRDDLVRRTRAAVKGSPRAQWIAVFLATAVVYLLTAHWQSGQVSDAIAASWPGWNLAHHGTLFLDDLRYLHDADYPEGNFAIYPINGHIVASRTMGIILTGVPVHFLLGWTGLGPLQGGALTAALMTAAAMANLSLLLRSIVSVRVALVATAVVAFGTPVWTVASAELWTHGPDLLWLTAGLLAATRGRHWWAGAAFGALFMTRPHVAVIALIVGLGATVETRKARTLLAYAATALAAMLLQLLATQLYYGEASLLGQYEEHVMVFAKSGSGFTNLVGALFSPGCGLFLFTPLALIALLVTPVGWRAAPMWTKLSALGGLVYVLLQMKLNTFNGGGGFYGYRLLLEGLVAAVPLWVFCLDRAWNRAWVRVSTAVTAVASLGIIGFGALLTPYWRGAVGDWDVWYPWHVAKAAGIAGLPAGVIVAAGIGVGLLLLRRTQED
jgi:alpha-1,2-mannosyltransferase